MTVTPRLIAEYRAIDDDGWIAYHGKSHRIALEHVRLGRGRLRLQSRLVSSWRSLNVMMESCPTTTTPTPT